MENNEMKKYRKKSQFGEIWRRLKKNKTAIAGLIIITILVLVAIFADLIADYDKAAIRQHVTERLQTPSSKHWFGTDAYGRDVFARIVHGARVSMTMGIVCVSISLILGGIFGAMCGFYGGKLDDIMMRVMDMMMCVPGILLALAIIAALGTGMRNLLIAMAISSVPGFTRLNRSVILPVVGQDFVEAAKACGTSDRRIVIRHILPNAVGPIIVQATMAISGMIIATAALSFIGFGVQPPSPEWGAMLAESKEYMANCPYLVIFPGLFIVTTALALNLFGDGLRDALDPRLKN